MSKINDMQMDRDMDKGVGKQMDKDFDQLLASVMKAPTPPAGLQQKLLAIPAQAETADRQSTLASMAASNDSIWRRALPVAACLGAFLLLAYRFQPAPNAALEAEILAHVYAEERFFANSEHITLQDVNARMEKSIGARLEASPATEALDVHLARDCWLAQAVTMHLILDGDTGPVSVMMIPSDAAEQESTFSDSRFTGTITPIDGGTLVVMGNRQEPVGKYFNLINDHMQWDY
jgi:hypothetical protein